jgi:hypothetical protein
MLFRQEGMTFYLRSLPAAVEKTNAMEARTGKILDV